MEGERDSFPHGRIFGAFYGLLHHKSIRTERCTCTCKPLIAYTYDSPEKIEQFELLISFKNSGKCQNLN